MAAEWAIILELAEENLEVIKSKFSSKLLNKNKIRIWGEITEKVNSLGVCLWTVQEVKDKWRGMVSVTKKRNIHYMPPCRERPVGERSHRPHKIQQGRSSNFLETTHPFPRISGQIESGNCKRWLSQYLLKFASLKETFSYFTDRNFAPKTEFCASRSSDIDKLQHLFVLPLISLHYLLQAEFTCKHNCWLGITTVHGVHLRAHTWRRKLWQAVQVSKVWSFDEEVKKQINSYPWLD